MRQDRVTSRRFGWLAILALVFTVGLPLNGPLGIAEGEPLEVASSDFESSGPVESDGESGFPAVADQSVQARQRVLPAAPVRPSRLTSLPSRLVFAPANPPVRDAILLFQRFLC